MIVESLNHRNLSVSELSQTTNFSKSKVLYVTRDLIDKGIVKIIAMEGEQDTDCCRRYEKRD